MIKEIVADLHTHTHISEHAYSSIYENINEASQKKLIALGITDHGPNMKDGAQLGYFRNLRVINSKVKGVRVLKGVEANIIDYNGSIDIPNDTLCKRLEFCIASFHEDVISPGTIEQHTNAYLKIAEHPYIDIIGHSGTIGYEFDYEKVLRQFTYTDKVVEINEASFKVRASSINNCRNIAVLCKKYKVPIVINTDAHFCESIGQAPQSIKMLNEIQFPSELVINSSKENLERWLKKKGIQL